MSNQAAARFEPEHQMVSDSRQRRNILIAMCVALMAVIASVSGLNVAQTTLAVDLDLDQSTILWIINAYILTLAALLMPAGAIGDRWGRRPVLLCGLVVFFIATIIAALASTGEIMIGARVLAGAGAAMIMPITLSIITSSFPEEERGNAIGIWAGVAGSGGIIGLLVSAFMVDYMTWRWLFVLPAGLVVIAFAMTLLYVPNSREHSSAPFGSPVIVASPCSGHGFKFVSVIGEILADLALHDTTQHNIDLFRLDRFAVA